MNKLNTFSVLAEMSAAELAAFETYLEPVSFDDGVIIIREGEQSRAMYFVVRGKVGIYKGTEGGGRIFLRTIEPGDHFGEMGLLRSGRRSASVHANGACELLKLTDRAFTEILKSPELASRFLLGLAKTLTARLADMSVRYAGISSLLSC
ncbi:MAG: cyclic nucleotide-binding domain-containing protein [Verrucomicrobiota bacterium]|jgi:CRP-like cAMP-binding protein